MTLMLFNLGPPKSGTTTLFKALTAAGIASLHWRDKTIGFVGRSLYANLYACRPVMADFPDHRAVTQADAITMNTSYWPQMDPALLRAVAEQNPGCQFVLPRRDPLDLARSIQRWGNFEERLHTMGAPGLPPRTATGTEALVRWIENHYRNVTEAFAHRRDFWSYEIADADAPALLSERLGVEITDWGIRNVNDGSGRRGIVHLEEDYT